jgi:hypothetical protein
VIGRGAAVITSEFAFEIFIGIGFIVEMFAVLTSFARRFAVNCCHRVYFFIFGFDDLIPDDVAEHVLIVHCFLKYPIAKFGSNSKIIFLQ